MKKNAGITLVALVITIIILLILAGVAISMITGGEGLFAKVNDAATKYNQAAKNEADLLNQLLNGNYLNNAGNGQDGEEDNPQVPEEPENPTLVEPSTVAKVGDFVNYSVKIDSNNDGIIDENDTVYDKWRILHFDTNGHMEIVCYNGPNFTLGETDNSEKSKSDYANCIKILNDASQTYKNGTYGYSARHFGSDPVNPNSYETISTEFIKVFKDALELFDSPQREYLMQIHHEADMGALGAFVGNKKLYGNISWVASRHVEHDTITKTCFFIRGVNANAYLNNCQICCISRGGYKSLTNCLAPVVSLDSKIKINLHEGNGSEETPWKLNI